MPLRFSSGAVSLPREELSTIEATTILPAVFLDESLRILSFTPPAEQLFNLTPDDIGRPLPEIVHHLEYPQLEADVQQALTKLAPLENEIRNPDGKCFLARLQPYRSGGDRVAGVVLTLNDITERKKAEAALAESQERLRLILDNARDFAIFSMDMHRRITSWNAGAEKILGYTESEILGTIADVIFTPEDQSAKVPEAEQRIAIKEGRSSDERWHMRSDGSRFWASGSMMAMRDASQEIVGLVKIFRDNTAARRSSEALAQSQLELVKALKISAQAHMDAENAVAAKDDFLAALSHELRTPLNPALLTISELETDPSLSEDVRARLTMARKNIELEARLIDDLLDVTRITKKMVTLRPTVCDLHELIDRATDIVMGDFGSRQFEFERQNNAAQHWVSGEPSRLQQIFWNLLKNAFKFTPPGGKITVVTRNPSPGRIAIAVSDTGIGLEEDRFEKIFKPFEQAEESTRHQFGGMGLGLAISKAFAELHGGKLDVSSKGLGKGATFILELDTSEAPNGVEEEPAQPTPANPRKLKLLVVEDHETTLQAMTWLLQRDGHEVFPADSAAAAFAIADREVCDVIVSDIGLPDISGLDFMREMKRLYGWPGIALSGYGMPGDIAQSKEAGFSLHLTKPIKVAELREALQTMDLTVEKR